MSGREMTLVLGLVTLVILVLLLLVSQAAVQPGVQAVGMMV